MARDQFLATGWIACCRRCQRLVEFYRGVLAALLFLNSLVIIYFLFRLLPTAHLSEVCGWPFLRRENVMERTEYSIEIGKESAQEFIRNERIDYHPFVALSDLHLVRKTFPIDYQGLLSTLAKHDQSLRLEVAAAAEEKQGKYGQRFDFDSYAKGFVAGVAAVWEQVKDKVVRER
jgi:hypothetical protein